MRSNGLPFALAALLVPAAVFAQTAEPATPPAEQVEAAAADTSATMSASSDTDGQAPATQAANADATPAAPSNEAPDPEQRDATIDSTGASTTSVAQTPPQQTPPQTEAEQAFNEIYGSQEYGDPNLPAAAVMPGTYDPWEKYNRRMHRFNNAVDRHVAKPLALGYVRAVPRPVRLGVSNFFNNLSQPLTMVNSLLQGKPKQAGQSLGRFLLNSTFGIAGIFDPATRAELPQKSEDFGQTLGVWGWKRSRYFELPLFGPRTVRDVFGMGGDAPLSPLRGVEADRVRVPLQGLQLVDVRAQLLSTDSLREGAEDDYTLVRDAWSQRRDYQIFGDRRTDDGRDLPEYLREDEDDSTVPVDAMPVMVPGNG